ncbi:MAG: hypothetical protein ABSA09_01825 [Desulfobaccales bacterium]|jgi:hypothetical protein
MDVCSGVKERNCKKFVIREATFLILLAAIVCFSPLPLIANAQAINITVADILANPDEYDGKMVQVAGWVSSPQFNSSRVGPYTTFNVGDKSGKALSVFSLGILSIKEGDFVRVTVRYNKSDRFLWIYSIEGPGNS